MGGGGRGNRKNGESYSPCKLIDLLFILLLMPLAVTNTNMNINNEINIKHNVRKKLMYSIIAILKIKIHNIPKSKSEGMITHSCYSIYRNQQILILTFYLLPYMVKKSLWSYLVGLTATDGHIGLYLLAQTI